MKHTKQLDLGFLPDLSLPVNSRKTYCQIARESMQYYSVDQTDLQSLLAILIGAKATPELCGRMASLGVKDLLSLSVSELKTVYGLSEKAASTVVAALGLAKKVSEIRDVQRFTIRSPEDVSKLMMPKLRHLTQEHFVCLFLNTKNQVIGEHTVFIGSLNSSIVHPREVFKEAIKRSSASIICLHNHPSSDPTPSKEDIEVTKRLQQAGSLIGIDVLDHVIIGDGSYCSLKEKGLF